MSKVEYDFDPRTGIGRLNSVHNIAYLRNKQIKEARLVIGRNGMILRDVLGGRTGKRCTPEIISEYERAAH